MVLLAGGGAVGTAGATVGTAGGAIGIAEAVPLLGCLIGAAATFLRNVTGTPPQPSTGDDDRPSSSGQGGGSEPPAGPQPPKLRDNPAVQAVAERSRTTETMGEYRKVRGHHVHSKKAFEGHVNYNPRRGFSISESFMESFGIRHTDITTAQRRLFTELSKSGRPNTLLEHTRIAVESLTEVGMAREQARTIVAQS